MKTSSLEDFKVKVSCFIDAALKKEISWITLEEFLHRLTPNLEKSKEVIKILLEIVQENQKASNDVDSSEKENELEEYDEYLNDLGNEYGDTKLIQGEEVFGEKCPGIQRNVPVTNFEVQDQDDI